MHFIQRSMSATICIFLARKEGSILYHSADILIAYYNFHVLRIAATNFLTGDTNSSRFQVKCTLPSNAPQTRYTEVNSCHKKLDTGPHM